MAVELSQLCSSGIIGSKAFFQDLFLTSLPSSVIPPFLQTWGILSALREDREMEVKV